MRRRSVAVICTVLNEANSIDELLGSLQAQTRLPDEVVIVDGGSADGTWERLLGWPDGALSLTVLRRPGANISLGRNEAIRAAQAEVIAVTDAGVRLDPGWLAALIAPFELEEPPPDVVSGFFVADPQSLFELVLGATTLPAAQDVDPDRFLPSSRSAAFFRAAWEEVRGYPEWLDYCEDVVFDLELKRAGRRFAWAPEAIVRFRPRPDLWRFVLQYFRYARGDGKARLWGSRHAIRYITYLGAPALLWGSRGHSVALAVLGLGALAYCRRPLQRLRPAVARLSRTERLAAAGLVPVIRATGDLAKMAGYPVGLAWRLRRLAALSALALPLRCLPGGSK